MNGIFKNVFTSTCERSMACSYSADAGIAVSHTSEYLVAFSVAIFVLASGAFVSQAYFVDRISTEAASLAEAISYGFSNAFSNIPAAIADNINVAADHISSVRANSYMAAVSVPVYWNQLQTVTESVGISESAAPNVTALRMDSIAAAEVAAGARSFVDMRSLASQALVLAENPNAGINSLLNVYQILGKSGYGAARAVLAGYIGLINRAGTSALALASSALAGARATPSGVYGVALFVGNTTIQTTHALVQTETMLAYEPARIAPLYARTSFVAINSLGQTLIAFSVRAPALTENVFSETVRAPSLIAPILSENVFSLEYRLALSFVSFSRVASTQYLAMIEGTGVLAYRSTATALAVPYKVVRGFQSSSMAFARGYNLEKQALFASSLLPRSFTGTTGVAFTAATVFASVFSGK